MTGTNGAQWVWSIPPCLGPRVLAIPLETGEVTLPRTCPCVLRGQPSHTGSALMCSLCVHPKPDRVRQGIRESVGERFPLSPWKGSWPASVPAATLKPTGVRQPDAPGSTNPLLTPIVGPPSRYVFVSGGKDWQLVIQPEFSPLGSEWAPGAGVWGPGRSLPLK